MIFGLSLGFVEGLISVFLPWCLIGVMNDSFVGYGRRLSEVNHSKARYQ